MNVSECSARPSRVSQIGFAEAHASINQTVGLARMAAATVSCLRKLDESSCPTTRSSKIGIIPVAFVCGHPVDLHQIFRLYQPG